MKAPARLVFVLIFVFLSACGRETPAPAPTARPVTFTPLPTLPSPTPKTVQVTPAPNQVNSLPIVLISLVRQKEGFTESVPPVITLNTSPGETAQFIFAPGPSLWVQETSPDGFTYTSFQPWQPDKPIEMRFCASLKEACSLPESWMPLGVQVIEWPVDWVGERQVWMRAQFREVNGATLLSAFGEYGTFQDESQITFSLAGEWSYTTPVAALPPAVQTALAPTLEAYPVTGKISMEDGRCCAGGTAGQTISVTLNFTATSPFGPVTEMRWAGGCLSEQEMDRKAAWEPLKESVEMPVLVPLNWIGAYASVQYRDGQGHLSPVYCDDISIEGSPAPLTPTP